MELGRRRIVTALNTNHLHRYFHVVRISAERLQRCLAEAADAGTSLEIQKQLTSYAIDITSALAFGHDLNTLQRGESELQGHIQRTFGMLARRLAAPVPYWRWIKLPADRALDRSMAELHRAVEGFIAQARERIAQRPELLGEPENFLEGMLPLLAGEHDVIVPTMLGHNGGSPMTVRPGTLEHLVDDAERLLDGLGLERAHLAGNSLGGWVALELARRGRARTVCALSPAGAWEGSSGGRVAVLSRTVRDTRRSRAILPPLARSGRVRRWALRDSAVHGERVSPAELLAMADDTIGCEIAGDLLAADAQLAPLDPPPCPITLAWSGRDRIFPVDVNGARARELIPAARFVVLDGVGHVPMLDDPQLVAQTILTATTAGSAAACPAAASHSSELHSQGDT